MSKLFAPRSIDDIVALIQQNPLAWIVSEQARHFASTLAPILLDLDSNGAIVGLTGHLARSNPHVATLQNSPRALFLFLGPHAYVSPSWFRDRTQAPTWIYGSAQIEAEVRFDSEQNDTALRRLVGAMEADRPRAWSVGEMGARYAELGRRVIAFQAQVTAVRGRFKLGQDERDDVYQDMLAGLGNDPAGAWARTMNTSRNAAE